MTLPVLGINCYAHDSAAALVDGGRVIAAAEEERFTRRKHTGEFPLEAIRFCLKQGGLSIADIRHAAFSFDPFLQFRKRLLHGLRFLDRRLILGRHASTVFFPFFLKQKLQASLGAGRKLNFKLHYVNHHRAHAASVFFTSPFEKAAILTVDGAGEWATTVQSVGEGTKIRSLAETNYPHSLGLFYGTLTQYLGFRPNYDEGKIMALASYARPDLKTEFQKMIRFVPPAGFKLNMDYFDFHFGATRWYSKRMEDLLGPAREPGSPLEDRHRCIAATLQWMSEEILRRLVERLHETTRLQDLCLAGGVALNCSANGKLLDQGPFERIFVQPACGDAGTALGAALQVHHEILNHPRRQEAIADAFLGPEYAEEAIQAALDHPAVQVRQPEHFEEEVAEIIAAGRTVGWFQGRMEFGPRALGERSILADPRTAAMRDYLNREIKFREPFRPFGGSVTEEDAARFFHLSQSSPFMLFAVKMREAFHARIPAILHRDGTSRIQTVSRLRQPQFWALLKAFEKKTGFPILVNTSFNLKDEPLVCSPADAVKTFLRSRLDALAMADRLVERTAVRTELACPAEL